MLTHGTAYLTIQLDLQRGELPFTSWREFPSDPRLVELALEGGPFKVGRIVTGSEFVTVERKVRVGWCRGEDKDWVVP